jgi:hypothetical protein
MPVSNLLVPVLASLGVALSECLKKSKRKWSKRWLTQRKKYPFANLLKELETKQPQDFHNYLCINNELFKNLQSLIRSRLEETKTFMRDAVSAEERLAVTQIFNYMKHLRRPETFRCYLTSFTG